MVWHIISPSAWESAPRHREELLLRPARTGGPAPAPKVERILIRLNVRQQHHNRSFIPCPTNWRMFPSIVRSFQASRSHSLHFQFYSGTFSYIDLLPTTSDQLPTRWQRRRQPSHKVILGDTEMRRTRTGTAIVRNVWWTAPTAHLKSFLWLILSPMMT